MLKLTDTKTLFAKETTEFDACGDLVQKVPEDLEKKLNAAFEERKNKILNAESEWKLGENGFIRYVSSTEGNDANDGLSPETPWKTLEKVMTEQKAKTVRIGDVVLFKRGDEWHGKFGTEMGVTYSAYGTGQKPRLLGSIEADSPTQWRETDIPCVYRYFENIPTTADVGNIVFNEGECYGQRVIKAISNDVTLETGSNHEVSNGINKWHFPPREFASYKDLAKIAEDIPAADLMYYYDRTSEELFIYSREGNPGKRFWSVELCTRGNAVFGRSGVTIDNLCIKYAGSHGVGAGSCANLTIRNCEVGWIGGSVQVTRDDRIVRYGNGIEVFGNANGFYAYNNYVYQCFDCGPTVQWQGQLKENEIKIAKNIEFYGNALCEAALEVWYTSREPATETSYAKLINCRMYDNLVTGSGTGWKAYNHQKQEWCAFYGGGETKAEYRDCVIENNCFWGERRHIMKSVPTTTKNGNGFNWKNNIIIHPLNEGSIGFLGENSSEGKGAPKQFWYSEKAIRKLVDNGTFDKNYFYYNYIGDIKNRRKFIGNNVRLFDED